MSSTGHDEALARIDAAIARIELAINRPKPNAMAADYAQLAARHESLKGEARAAVDAIDQVLSGHRRAS